MEELMSWLEEANQACDRLEAAGPGAADGYAVGKAGARVDLTHVGEAGPNPLVRVDMVEPSGNLFDSETKPLDWVRENNAEFASDMIMSMLGLGA